MIQGLDVIEILEVQEAPKVKLDPLAVLKIEHPEIFTLVREAWGTRRLHDALNRMVLNSRPHQPRHGGERRRKARKPFDTIAANAILELAERHDREFGFSAVPA